jgi:HEPN domain-containing protein
VNRAELQQMTEQRLLDAKALLDGGRWEFAYYAAGYAVECALKSCILARMIYTGWVFQEKLKGNECLTHDFGELIKIAGMTELLNDQFKTSAAAGGAFVANWGVVNQWKVTSRYDPKTETEARALYAAITDDPDGVLRWIKAYW